MSDDRTGVGEGPDIDENGQDKDGDKATKTQDLVKAGRDDVDPDAGTE